MRKHHFYDRSALPVDEGSLCVHQVKLVVQPFERKQWERPEIGNWKERVWDQMIEDKSGCQRSTLEMKINVWKRWDQIKIGWMAEPRPCFHDSCSVGKTANGPETKDDRLHLFRFFWHHIMVVWGVNLSFKSLPLNLCKISPRHNCRWLVVDANLVLNC